MLRGKTSERLATPAPNIRRRRIKKRPKTVLPFLAMLLAVIPRYLAGLRLVLLLRPLEYGCLGRKLRCCPDASDSDRAPVDPLLYGQLVRSMSNHETKRVGR